MLIVIDGIDGCGKSTQVKSLAEDLTGKGHSVVVSKWQDSSYIQKLYIGDLLKRIQEGSVVIPPESRTFLLAADIAYRLQSRIKPWLDEGKIVIGDRYIYKVIAQGIARGLDKTWLLDLFSFAPKPDLVIMLDVLPEVACDRITSSREISFYEAGLDVLDESDKATAFVRFQSDVRKEFLKLMDEMQGLTIDGNLPLTEQTRQLVGAVDRISAGKATDVAREN